MRKEDFLFQVVMFMIVIWVVPAAIIVTLEDIFDMSLEGKGIIYPAIFLFVYNMVCSISVIVASFVVKNISGWLKIFALIVQVLFIYAMPNFLYYELVDKLVKVYFEHKVFLNLFYIIPNMVLFIFVAFFPSEDRIENIVQNLLNRIVHDYASL